MDTQLAASQIRMQNWVAIIRDQKSIIPNGNTQLLADDKVLLVTNEENRAAIVKEFQRKKR